MDLPTSQEDSNPPYTSTTLTQAQACCVGDTAALVYTDVAQMIQALSKTHRKGIAVIDALHQLTYAQLWEQSGRVAYALAVRGLQNQVIGLYASRNIDLLVGMLGIWRAGACLLPLDPENPTERTRAMLQRSGCQHVVGDLVHVDSISGITNWDIADLKSVKPPRKALSQGIAEVDSQSPAYCMFTSGSTGQPKGITMTQANLMNIVTGFSLSPSISAGDTVLAMSTITFDIFIIELLLPLLVGATIVIATRNQVKDGLQLQGLVKRHNVSVLQATPTGWQVLLAGGWQGGSHIKALSGGEKLPEDLAARLLPKVGELWNLYGPTESTVYVSRYRVDDPSLASCIGEPFENVQFYILDNELKPVAQGEKGELCVGGLSVSLGYLGLPRQTSESFLTLSSGARIYRTGDIVYQGDDQRIYYHGRVDDQVKIHGYRIELSDIEVNLRSHVDINNAAVVIRKKSAQDTSDLLVAYCQSEPGVALEPDAIRDYLAGSLPDYMIPAHINVVKALPYSASQKIDKKVLQQWDREGQNSQDVRLDEWVYEHQHDSAFTHLMLIKMVFLRNTQRDFRFCYYELAEDAYIPLTELRKYVRAALADGIPVRRFIEIDDWPMIESGLDWRSLYIREQYQEDKKDPTERYISQLWSDVLGGRSIRPVDNFFDVGGNSLLATQVLARLRKEKRVVLPLERLWMNNLRGFASECSTLLRTPPVADSNVLTRGMIAVTNRSE